MIHSNVKSVQISSILQNEGPLEDITVKISGDAECSTDICCL